MKQIFVYMLWEKKQNYSSGKIYPESHDLELAADYQRICGMR